MPVERCRFVVADNPLPVPGLVLQTMRDSSMLQDLEGADPGAKSGRWKRSRHVYYGTLGLVEVGT
jgi:hypothetical protein